MNDVKKMDIKEFRSEGYLQEVNRQFLHPLGLALEVTLDDDHNEVISGVWDCRDDKEGINYDYKNSNKNRLVEAKIRATTVSMKQGNAHFHREKALGYVVEPIPQP